MKETRAYANELGKQGGKNPRKIPKFSINHERFSRTIEKKSKVTPTHSSYCILSHRQHVPSNAHHCWLAVKKEGTIISAHCTSIDVDSNMKLT